MLVELTSSDYFNHLDIAGHVGTTGIGIDLATPVGPYVQLRAGFSFMPRVDVNSNFSVQVGDSTERKWDANGNRIETKFDRLSKKLEQYTGYEVKDQVTMVCTPYFYNFKLLADIYPFQDHKEWHVTAGFYVGNATIGKAVNSASDMKTLLAVQFYNKVYDKVMAGQTNIFGLMSLSPTELYDMQDKLEAYGKMCVGVGYYAKDFYDDQGNLVHAKGDPYLMEPDAEAMVSAKAKANRFKPYLGFGYSCPLSRNGLTQFSVDCGVLFWGGVPDVYTHDGTNLTHDVEHIGGKVGTYVNAFSKLPVMPVLELRISRRLF